MPACFRVLALKRGATFYIPGGSTTSATLARHGWKRDLSLPPRGRGAGDEAPRAPRRVGQVNYREPAKLPLSVSLQVRQLFESFSRTQEAAFMALLSKDQRRLFLAILRQVEEK